MTPGTTGLIIENLFLGFRFDLRLALVMLVPAILFINLPLNPAFKVRLMNWLYGILLTVVNFLYIVDAGYFGYLKSRLNATVIQFLKNPIISFEMVRESYPWPVLLIVIILLSVAWYFILSRFIFPVPASVPLSSI